MTLDKLMLAIGEVPVGDWPTYRAARLAGELLEELRRPQPDDTPGECFLCGWPNTADGCCSRAGCANSD